jgi:hypothetical protein
MSTKNNAIVAATASAIANALWAQVTASFELSKLIASLFEATSRDIKQAGEAVGLEWNQIGGEIEGGLPTRLLVEACHQTSLTKEETRLFIKATGLVSKQRAHVLTSAVFDGISAGEAKGKGKGKGEKGKGKEAVNPPLTAADVVKAIQSMTLTAADAEAIVRAVQAKLA